jgi:rubredoxin
MRRDLFSPPPQPYGYRCPACDHVWDAPGPPAGTWAEVERILDLAIEAHCPECGVIGPCTLSPQRYAERRRAAQDAEASAT